MKGSRETVAKIRGEIELEAVTAHADMCSRLNDAEADLAAAQKARAALVARAADGTLATGATRIADEKVREAEGLVSILREGLPAAERRVKLAAEAANALLQEETARLLQAAEARSVAAAEALGAAQAEFQAAGFHENAARELVGMWRVIPDPGRWREIVVARIAEAKAALDAQPAARLGRAA